MKRVAVEAWIASSTRAKELFAGGAGLRRAQEGRRREGLQARRAQREGRPSTSRTRCARCSRSNVVAKLEGSDAKLKDEYVVYTAHWDHLGKDPKLQGDQIYQRRARQRLGHGGNCSRSPRRIRSSDAARSARSSSSPSRPRRRACSARSTTRRTRSTRSIARSPTSIWTA